MPAEISQYSPDMLIFIDETGSDRRKSVRAYVMYIHLEACHLNTQLRVLRVGLRGHRLFQ
jgi:hypothetical protein